MWKKVLKLFLTGAKQELTRHHSMYRAMQKRPTTVFRKIRFSQSCVADASIPSVVSWWHGVARVVFVREIGSGHPTRNWKKGGKAI